MVVVVRIDGKISFVFFFKLRYVGGWVGMTDFHFVEVCVEGTNPGISTFLDGFSGEICCYISWEMWT